VAAYTSCYGCRGLIDVDSGYWGSGRRRCGGTEGVVEDDDAAGARYVCEEESFDFRIVILDNGWIIGRGE